MRKRGICAENIRSSACSRWWRRAPACCLRTVTHASPEPATARTAPSSGRAGCYCRWTTPVRPGTAPQRRGGRGGWVDKQGPRPLSSLRYLGWDAIGGCWRPCGFGVRPRGRVVRQAGIPNQAAKILAHEMAGGALLVQPVHGVRSAAFASVVRETNACRLLFVAPASGQARRARVDL